MSLPRDPSSYRAARRNIVLRDLHSVWGRQHYYRQAPAMKHRHPEPKPLVTKVVEKIVRRV